MKRSGFKQGIRQRKCANRLCRTPFIPARQGQKVCGSLECAEIVGKEATAKVIRKDTRDRKLKIKGRQEWLDEAQDQVNRYVRRRDQLRGYGCISCDRGPNWGGQWHASHYRSKASASAVRFNLWNIHMSCSQCNYYKSGNIIDYTPRLIEKIGADRVAWLKTQNQLTDYSIDYLARLKKIFSRRANKLEKKLQMVTHIEYQDLDNLDHDS